MRVVALVLAAGASARLGRAKQNLAWSAPHSKETLLDHAIRIAREATDDVIVVTRDMNPDADEGMASSIRTGVALAGNDARILITLCDQPRITSDHLRALIASNAPIVATGYSGIAGVPAIFAPQFIPELLALRGDRGARGIIERHGATVIPFEDAAFDIDVMVGKSFGPGPP